MAVKHRVRRMGHPYDEWFRAAPCRLIRGTHYDGATDTILNGIRQAAKLRGLLVRIDEPVGVAGVDIYIIGRTEPTSAVGRQTSPAPLPITRAPKKGAAR